MILIALTNPMQPDINDVNGIAVAAETLLFFQPLGVLIGFAICASLFNITFSQKISLLPQLPTLESETFTDQSNVSLLFNSLRGLESGNVREHHTIAEKRMLTDSTATETFPVP
jgi:hypothetical protein